MAIVNGYIKNTTGQAIPFASVQILDSDFTPTGEGAASNSNGYFYLTIDPNNEPYAIVASSVGYKPLAVSLSTWVNGNIILLQKNVIELDPVVVTSGSQDKWKALLLLIPLFLILKKDKARKVSGIGKVDTNNVVLIGGGLVALMVVNKILVALGIGKGAGGHAVDTEQNDPGSEWKPAYYKSLPAGTQYYTLTASGGDLFSKQIYNAFTLFKDNFDQIMGVFNQLQTKTQVSVLADYFQQKYNRDLLTFLKDGGGVLPWDGLSDAQFYTLTTYVNNLPNTWP